MTTAFASPLPRTRPDALLALLELVAAREDPVRDRIDAAAREVGRLRRRIEGDGAAPSTSSLAHLADRLSDHLECLDCMTHPCAHELYVDFLAECGDEDVAVEEALRVVDERARTLRALLGVKTEM